MPTVTLPVPWVRTSSLGTLSMNTSFSAVAGPITSFDQGYSLRTVTANTNTYVLSTGTMTYLQNVLAYVILPTFDFTFVVQVAQTVIVTPLVDHAFIQILPRPMVFHSLASQDPFLFHSLVGAVPMIFHQRGVREMELIQQILMPVTTFDRDRTQQPPTTASACSTAADTMTYNTSGLAQPVVDFSISVV